MSEEVVEPPPWPTELTLTTGPPANGGSCVARHEGRVVFVRYALPGETVKLRVVGETMQLLGQRGQGGGTPGGGGGGGERQERPANRAPAPQRGKPAPAKSNAPSEDYYQDYEGPDDGGQGGPQDDIPF